MSQEYLSIYAVPSEGWATLQEPHQAQQKPGKNPFLKLDQPKPSRRQKNFPKRPGEGVWHEESTQFLRHTVPEGDQLTVAVNWLIIGWVPPCQE